MKKLLLICLLLILNTPIFANTDTILQEIKNLRIDMNKRFEQVDKRFEQVDKRFEQVDKRFDFLQQLIFVLMSLIFISPFLAIYLKNNKDANYEKHVDTLKAVVFALKNMAKHDKELSKSLKMMNI